jgi:ribosome-binding factor A
MSESRRQKKIASLLKSTLGLSISEITQQSQAGLVSITRVEVSKDLKTARIFLSGGQNPFTETILSDLNRQAKRLRKLVASRTDLKYNPMLIFEIDPTVVYHEKVNRLLEEIRENEKESD